MDNNHEIDIKQVVQSVIQYKNYLYKKNKLIILISIICSFVFCTYSHFKQTQFLAELTFVVEKDASVENFGSASSLIKNFGFDLGGSSSTFSKNNIIELLKSRLVLNKALMKKYNVNEKDDLLINHYLEINNYKKEWRENDVKVIDFNEEIKFEHDSIMRIVWKEIVNDNLLIEIDKNESNIITLTFNSINEKFSKYFAESLIQEMSSLYISHQTKQAMNTLSFLQDRADSVFKELKNSEQEYARIKDINQRIVKASGRLKELRLMREVEVLNTMYLEIVKNLEISKITLLNQTPIINIIDTPILPLKKEESSLIIFSILGLFFGLFFSCSIYILKKAINDILD